MIIFLNLVSIYLVVIVVTQSATLADQALQELRLNGNESRNSCNSISDQLATVVEVESGSTSRTIITVADKSTFNGNIHHRLSSTENSLRDHSHGIIFHILYNDESIAEFHCN